MTQFQLSQKSGIPRWRIAYAEVGYLRLRHEEMKTIRRVLDTEQDKTVAA
jgi:hypothetical protein